MEPNEKTCQECLRLNHLCQEHTLYGTITTNSGEIGQNAFKTLDIEIEVWQPVNNKSLEEVHYYFKGQYIGGLNPHLFSKEAKEEIEAIIRREVVK